MSTEGWSRGTWGEGPWGQPSQQNISFSITGLGGTSAVGTCIASIPKSVDVIGFSATGSVGSIASVVGNSNVTETNVVGTTALGTVVASRKAIHFNSNGYRLIGEAITKRLKADGIIPLNSTN